MSVPFVDFVDSLFDFLEKNSNEKILEILKSCKRSGQEFEKLEKLEKLLANGKSPLKIFQSPLKVVGAPRGSLGTKRSVKNSLENSEPFQQKIKPFNKNLFKFEGEKVFQKASEVFPPPSPQQTETPPALISDFFISNERPLPAVNHPKPPLLRKSENFTENLSSSKRVRKNERKTLHENFFSKTKKTEELLEPVFSPLKKADHKRAKISIENFQSNLFIEIDDDISKDVVNWSKKLLNFDGLQSGGRITEDAVYEFWAKNPFEWEFDVLDILKDFFNFDDFRGQQKAIVNSIISNCNVLAVLPTGAGKSLCYQLPALYHFQRSASLAIVISPLLSLMEDQVDHLIAKGIPCARFGTDLKRDELNGVYDLLNHNKLAMLFVSPEKFNSLFSKDSRLFGALSNLHRKGQISLCVVDEAHCIVEWGADFRKEYLSIGLILEKFLNGVPIAAFTASATGAVRQQICKSLRLEVTRFKTLNCSLPVVFIQSIFRKNIFISVNPRPEMAECVKILKDFDRRGLNGIIYCTTKKECENICYKLTIEGLKCAFYHGGLNAGDRKETQQMWMKNEIRWMAATVAFGMGVDKPDVRLVIHMTLPSSMERYYQELGRCGRDGLPSHAILWHRPHDKEKILSLPNSRSSPSLEVLCEFVDNDSECRWRILARHFQEKFDSCGGCDTCLRKEKEKSRAGVTKEHPRQGSSSSSPIDCQTFTTEITLIYRFLYRHCGGKSFMTASKLRDLLKGRKVKGFSLDKWFADEAFGALKASPNELVEVLIKHLISRNVILEQQKSIKGNFKQNFKVLAANRPPQGPEDFQVKIPAPIRALIEKKLAGKSRPTIGEIRETDDDEEDLENDENWEGIDFIGEKSSNVGNENLLRNLVNESQNSPTKFEKKINDDDPFDFFHDF